MTALLQPPHAQYNCLCTASENGVLQDSPRQEEDGSDEGPLKG